ncbi:mannose-1-phosphate guanylyltransferase [Candidatus Shapirobacteria bacterium CG09_land_8_20_14_0_10_49_15]|uniref:mannose-1-phosphate guanylyltransferase n=1 Tax=Candidatus Shapirobacteria bacterium CG09_land_8_20_14_0_10_49_15 TaxID=1974482 RepID=A0A2M6XB00_9BACT|nr:MAG: mannose-1-phosphate guanylyltransferase [Candidatus Shapirobacteria bacterium CG09_land_8_20_14_0_10_49_15]
MSSKDHLYALIICGGGGTRLWPRSRNATPKQFSKLFGQDTLFQKTVKRLHGLVKPANVFVVTTSQAYAREISKEAPALPAQNIVWEPMRRNTAIACGLGTLLVKKQDPQAVVLNFWADHLIAKEAAFQKVERVAAQAAFDHQTLVAIGVKPTHPHTGYGYIHAPKVRQKINGVPVYRLEKFTEKPDKKTARKFVASGEYYWNSGMYVWPVEFFMMALKKHSPATYQALAKVAPVLGTSRFQQVLAQAYEKAPEVSVDVAVSEKVTGALMVPAAIGWNDVGDWSAIYELSVKDKQGNAVIKYGKKGEFVGIDAKNNLVQFDDQLIVLIGVEDLVVVDTTDAVLICRRDNAQAVKKLMELLKAKQKAKYL